MARRWARIWCVRPVSRRTRSSVVRGSARSSSKCVTAARVIVGVGRHPGAHPAVAPQRRVDGAAARRRPPLDERQVLAGDRAGLQRVAQRAMDRLRARHHEQPGRVAIQAVHDPGAGGVLAAGGDRAQRLGERARAVPARRVHDDAGGLVDHEQVLVGVGHGVGRVRQVARRRLLGLLDGDQLAGAQEVALGRRAAVDEHEAGLDQALRARTRAQRRRQEGVEPRARVLRRRSPLHCAGAR